MLLGCTFALALSAAAAAPAPSVYWTSNPTLPNETLVVAGAFSEDRQAKLCTTRDCSGGSVVPTPALTGTWAHSVKVVLPAAGCGPPCFLHVTDGSSSPAAAVVEVNAPDLWWALSGSPARQGGTQDRSNLSNLPTRVAVQQGDTLRLFGRSLAWTSDHKRCTSAAGAPGPVPTTRLRLKPAGNPVPSLWATCYEAAFDTAGMGAGHYPAAALTTPWGASQALDLTIVAAPPSPPPHQIVVDPAAGGASPAKALAAAIKTAAQYVAAHADALVEVQLGRNSYKLAESLVVPERTTLAGAGAGLTTLEFALLPPPPPAPPQRCSTPVLADFYTADCEKRGCRTRECPGCFLEVGVSHSAFSVAGCCAACGANPRCNAYTFVGSVDKPGGYCGLSYCPDEPKDGHPASCATTPSTPTPSNRTSGWILGRTKIPTSPAAAIVVTGHATRLANFSVRIASAFAHTPAIWAQANSTAFASNGLNITLLQDNVSNAFKLEGVGWEVAGNTMNQVGSCNYPNYGPHSDGTPFQPSVTIYAHDSRAGLLANNTVYWRCSAFDLDVSDRVIFEENRFICTETGVVPHGNSISGYDWRSNPSSRFWSVARNRLSRPPYKHGAEQNWVQRETLTTDGSGSWGTAHITSMAGATLQLRWLTLGTAPVPGTTLLVLQGPGVGQSRLITAVGPTNKSVVLDRPLDGWVVLEQQARGGGGGGGSSSLQGGSQGSESAGPVVVSLVAVVSSFGSKIFAGNHFNWTEVVQWYGNTLRGVMSDNTFSDCNVQPGGNIGRGAMGAVGECYHGVDEVWFSEFRDNALTRSDGISLRDSYMSKNGEGGACAAYGGPWVRWSVIRGNSMSGISQASEGVQKNKSQMGLIFMISLRWHHTRTHAPWGCIVSAAKQTKAA